MAESSGPAVGTDSVAVIGLACRFPDADDPPTLLDTILTGRRAFRRVPPSRLDLAAFEAADQPDVAVHHGAEAGLLTGLGNSAAAPGPRAGLIEGWRFDQKAFRIPVPVYAATDPAHWLALETAARALAAAGFPGGTGLDRDRIGVIIGNSLAGDASRASALRLRWPYVRRVLGESLFAGDVPADRARRVLRHAASRYLAPLPRLGESAASADMTIPARISSYFGFRGGGHAVDGAFASSLQAVASACAALTARDIDVALAGGVDLSLDPLELIAQADAAADRAPGGPDGTMRIYDERPTGYLPGEGCGIVVLMRTAQARQAGLPVYAEIIGWGTSAGGMPGVVASDASSQLLALRRAYERAGADPGDVRLIEGHGGGTPTADEAELTALAELRADARQTAALGSIKANIGHAKAAAGAAGLIKTVLALGTGIIPPTTGVVRPHPLLRSGDAPFWLPEVPEEWPAGSRLAGVSAMGIGGVNVHLVLRSAAGRVSRHDRVLRVRPRPARSGSGRERAACAVRADTSRPPAAYLLHGQDRSQLAANLARIAELARWLSDAELTDLAGQLGRDARIQGPARVAIVARHQEELARRAGEAIALLPVLRDGLLATRPGIFAAENGDGRVTLLLSDDPAPAALGGGPVSGSVSGSVSGPVSGPVGDTVSGAQLAPTRVASRRARNARPAGARLPRDIDSSPEPICRLLATLRWFEALDVSATAIVGHGLGEIAGLAWAGVLSEADVVEIAALRAEYLSGPAVRVLPASGRHAGRHRDADPVPASDPLTLLRDAVAQFRFGPPRRRLISTRTGRELASAGEVIDLICGGFAAKDHLTEAVAAGAVGATLLVETGPGQLLAATAARACRVPTISMDLGEANAGRAGRTWAGAALFAAGAIGQVLPLFAGQPSRPIDMWRDRVFITSGAAPAGGPDHTGMSEGARSLDVAAPVRGGVLEGAGSAGGSVAAPRTGPDTRTTGAGEVATHQALPVIPPARRELTPGSPGPAEIGQPGQSGPGLTSTAPSGEAGTPSPFHSAASGQPAGPAQQTTALHATHTADPARPAARAASADTAASADPGGSADTTTPADAVGPDGAAQPADAAQPALSARPAGAAGPTDAARAANGAAQTDAAEPADAAQADVPSPVAAAEPAHAAGLTAKATTPTGIALNTGATRPGSAGLLARTGHSAPTEVARSEGVPRAGAWRPKGGARFGVGGPGGAGRLVADTVDGVDSWVRCFTEELRPAPRPAESADGRPWRMHVATKNGPGKDLGSWFAADEAADRTLLVADDLAEPGAVAVVLRAVGEAVAETGQLTVITTGAGLTGLLASVHAEHPSLGVTVLRVPATEAGRRAARPFADARPGKFRELVVGADGSVSEPALAALELSGGGDFPLGPSDVALVSRACGGSALALAQVLACCGAAVAVIGQAGPDDDDHAVAGLEELRLAGARVTYEVVDPTSPADMALAVQRIESRLGPVTAIAHGIRAGAPTQFGELTEQVLRDRLDAERAALLDLLRPVRTHKLRLILTFGSVTERYGQAEQGPLAAASAAVADQAAALAARVPGCQAQHVRRPAWAGSGLGEPSSLGASMAAAGTAPIVVGDMARWLLKMLATPGLPGRVGLHGRIGSLGRSQAGPAAGPGVPGRFLDEVKVHYPGIELVCDARLSLTSDPYLADYRVDGLPVLAPAMAIEAMAQGASALAGRPLRQVTGVTLEAPVVVPPAGGEPTRVRVCALAEGDKITTVLRCEESGFGVDHVRAEFHLDAPADHEPAVQPAADATGLVDGAELYGPVCFQTGRFRRIAMLPEVSSRSCRALARGADERPWFVAPGQLTLERLAPGPLTPDRLPPREALAMPVVTGRLPAGLAGLNRAGTGGTGGTGANGANGANGEGANGERLLLGSPGLNDVVLQVLQACVPHRRVWLAGCASVSFSGRLADGPVEVRATARPPAPASPAPVNPPAASSAPANSAAPDPASPRVSVPAPARSPDRTAAPRPASLPLPSGLTWDVQVVDSDEQVLATWRGVRLREAGLLPRNAAWPPPLLSVYLERAAAGLGLDPGLRVAVRCGEPAGPATPDAGTAITTGNPITTGTAAPPGAQTGVIPRPRAADASTASSSPAGSPTAAAQEPQGGGGPWMNGRRIVDVPLPDGPLAVIPKQAGQPDGPAIAKGTGPLAGFTLEAGGVRSAACGWAAADPQHAVWPADEGLLASLAAAFSRLRNHLSESPASSGARLRAVAACLAMANAPERAPVVRERATGDGWALLEIAGARVACNVVEISGVSCPVAVAIQTDPPRGTRRPAQPAGRSMITTDLPRKTRVNRT